MSFREYFITNTWWGKILGGFFGFLIAGPVGACFGILLGNFFDKGLSSHLANPHWLYHAEKTEAVRKQFFETTFFVMGYLAKVDGRVSEEEIHLATLLMQEMRLTKEQKAYGMRLFNQGKTATSQLETVLIQLKNSCYNKPGLLRLFLDIQYRVALIDGLTPQKIQALNTIITHLGFAPFNKQYRFYEDFAQAYSQQQQQQRGHSSRAYTTNTVDLAYALLGVDSNASKLEVKRAYRRAMSQNHPDKLIAQGLPQEMIALANDKTQKIIKAYEAICKKKGW